ncbi:MAG TPA: oligosaccharide flippase family protein, partial [Phototrophicaceae bacterium]|nr:oligosaccharide flippase family protein [Phototrophicaceae bacterium]
MNNRNLDLRRFASDVGINFLRVSLMTVFGIGISIYLARGLGTEGKGFYELAIFLPTVLQAVLNIGSQLFTVYYVGTGKYDVVSAARGNLTLTIWMSFVGTGIGLLIILAGSNLLFPGVPRHLLFISLALLPFLYARPSLSAIFQGKQEFRAFSTIELIPYLINLIVLVITISWFPDREAAAIIAVLLGNIISVIYAIYLLRRLAQSQDQRSLFTLRIDSGYLRDVLSYGLKAQSGLIMLFLLFRVDVYLINQIGGGAASVGIYSIAVVLAERIWVFTGFAAQVMMPRIASWEGENEKRTELTLLTMRYTLWLSFVIAALALIFGGWVIQLLYGSDFAPAVTALFLIMPGIITY